MNRSQRLKLVCSAFDVANQLPVYDQIRIYVEMLTFEEVKSFAEPEIGRIRDQLINAENYNMLDVLKNCLFDIGIEFNYNRPKAPSTFYTNTQNVHMLAKSTEKTAMAIIKAYPSQYYRPSCLSFKNFDYFFNSIENFTYHAFEPRNLFASVYACIMTSQNTAQMLERLKEEILESDGMCLTGCVVRLINALRGFDIDQFETTLDEYEHERAKSFHRLTKAIRDFNIDVADIIPGIENLVNNKIVKLSKKFDIKILEAYTGVNWLKQNGKYCVK